MHPWRHRFRRATMILGLAGVCTLVIARARRRSATRHPPGGGDAFDDPAGDNPAGANRAGANRGGANRGGANRAGADRAGADAGLGTPSNGRVADRPITTDPIRSTGRITRGAATATMATRIGVRTAAVRARQRVSSPDTRDRLEEELALRTSEDVVRTLGNMKGALMKIGQMASFILDSLPEPIAEAISSLQQDAPPMSAELAASVVHQELGAEPDDVFGAFDETPLAAASIGQVHRAMTRDGRAVAVKIQYPGVGGAIMADLENLDLAGLAAPFIWKGLDMGALVAELKARLGEEVDYRIEAANQTLFADFYRGHPFIHVPDVVPELSTRCVLTCDLAEGARFAELEIWPQSERNAAAEAIFRFVFRSLYRLRAFNGDPHPGNYLFRPDGHVSFLDFGLVKHFRPADLDMLFAILDAALLHPNAAALREATQRAGFLAKGATVTDDELVEFMAVFVDLLRERAPTLVTHGYASDIARRYLLGHQSHANVMRWSNIPATYAILQRINLGLVALVGKLEASASWRGISEEMWPAVDAPPSTPMGEAEQEWWAAARARLPELHARIDARLHVPLIGG